jgi:phosphoribosylaminoimidazole-succinocarboxamide synthase
MTSAIWQTSLPGLPAPRRGKVRDIYDLGDTLLIVACDRISAYDHVLQPAVPGKGKILNQLTNSWFELLSGVAPNHLLATDPQDFPAAVRAHEATLRGRAVLVRKAEVIPFECVVRGYLAGSAHREYLQSGQVCGIALPAGLERASALPEPVFTPATKAVDGHDENVSFEVLSSAVGLPRAEELRRLSLELYRRGRDRARPAGLILADTKFELGLLNGELLLVDEVLTPDSSRYWDVEAWCPGEEPASYDKQYVRNWLDECGWDHESPPPQLPESVIQGTLERYLEAFRRLTGRDPDL